MHRPAAVVGPTGVAGVAEVAGVVGVCDLRADRGVPGATRRGAWLGVLVG
jgi:hypothetical protein